MHHNLIFTKMKTSITILHNAKSNGEETPKKANAGKLVKFAIVLSLVIWVSLLSSCAVIIRAPFPGPYIHGGCGHVCYFHGGYGPGFYGHHGFYYDHR